MRSFIIAALSALALIAVPAVAHAEPAVGEPCYWQNGAFNGTVVSLPAPDFYGCDDGSTVNTSVWFYTPTDPSDPCYTWGRDARSAC